MNYPLNYIFFERYDSNINEVGVLVKIDISKSHRNIKGIFTLLGIIMTGIKWWVKGNFAIFFPNHIFAGRK